MATPGDGFPLTDIELTRWNAAQPARDVLCCPRHPAEALVGGHHEATNDPAWLCAVCGYITPVTADDMAAALGATELFTEKATVAFMRADTRLYVPDHPARTGHGTLAINTIRPAMIGAATLAGVGLLAAIVLPWLLVAACLGLAAGIAAWTWTSAATRHAIPAYGKASTPLHRVTDAATLGAGHWVPVVHRHEQPRLTSKVTRSAARITQVVRCGGTDLMRITTTAGVITTPATTRAAVLAMESLAPGLNDYTYLLPSNRTHDDKDTHQ